MIRLLLALLLLPVFAHGAAGTACWDGSYTTGSCPVRVLSITPDLAPAATTASITVNLEAAADTLYVWVKAAVAGVCPTAPTVAQVVSGTGSPIFHDDVASPTLGDNVVALTGLTADTEYCTWAVASKNGIPSAQTHGNSAARTASIPWFTSPVPGGLVKWNPGHYMMPVGEFQSTATQTALNGFYDGIATDTAVKGVALRIPWGLLERDTQGNYTAGKAFIQAQLDYLAGLAVPKRFWLRVEMRMQSVTSTQCSSTTAYSTSTTWTQAMPQYIRAWGGSAMAGSYCWPALWETQTKDAFIDMLEAYAAEFDSHPLFEGITIWKETSMGGTPADGTYTAAGLVSALQDAATAAKAAWATTNVVMNINNSNGVNGGNATIRNAMIAWFKDNGVGMGGPDLAPGCVTATLTCPDGFTNPQSGSHRDAYQQLVTQGLAGVVPVAYSVEVSELGSTSGVGQSGGYSPTALGNFCNGTSTGMSGGEYTLGCTHVFWHRNASYGTSEQKWGDGSTAGIWKWIKANPAMVNASCPTSHSAGCASGGLPE